MVSGEWASYTSPIGGGGSASRAVAREAAEATAKKAARRASKETAEKVLPDLFVGTYKEAQEVIKRSGRTGYYHAHHVVQHKANVVYRPNITYDMGITIVIPQTVHSGDARTDSPEQGSWRAVKNRR